MDTPKKILIVRTDRIGDVILSTPTIKNIRVYFPDAHIAFMCNPQTRDIIEGNPYVDEVIVYDKKRTHKSLWASIRFALRLRKKNFDWVFILHPTNRVHIITFFAGIPVRIGWDKKMGWLLTKRVCHTKQQGLKHELEYTLDMLRVMDIPVMDKLMYFPLRDSTERDIKALLAQKRLQEKKFIVMHPSASCPSKQWPQEYFSELIRLLRDKTSLDIVIITAESEKQNAEHIIKENDLVDLRGLLDISALGSLLKRAALLISNDSGPVHVACALNTPVIAIFGRSDPGLSPRRWRPLGENAFYFHKYVDCPECLAHNCTKGFLCLKEIRPREVFERALAILEVK